jgi:hypothetical protein
MRAIEWDRGRTWVARTAVGTHIVARDCLDQVLQRALVARLLALVQGRSHGVAGGGAGRNGVDIVGGGRTRATATRGEACWARGRLVVSSCQGSEVIGREPVPWS